MQTSRPRVVIIGGNFAGLVAASKLSSDLDVTVIDARIDFEWTPNIHEILSGVKHRENVVLSRADCVERYGHTFLHDTVTRIDPDNEHVLTEGGLVLPYDACLIAAGSQRQRSGVEGAEQHALNLRLVDDAVKIADRLDSLAERDKRASIVIVGGGVTGVEAAGEILRRRGQGNEYDIHIVEIESRILGQLPRGLSDDAEHRMQAYPVTVHTGETVDKVTSRSVTLGSGKRLRADLCIWSAGMTLPAFLENSGLADEDDAWLPVDDMLRSRYDPSIFVAGDCAELPEPIRKQAYNAMSMGEVAGDNIARLLDGRRLKRFRPLPMPMLISFGDITTWLVAGDFVVASPVLATGKEAVYQATMARLASPLQPLKYSSDIIGRASLATHKLLLPQLTPKKIIAGLMGSRIVS